MKLKKRHQRLLVNLVIASALVLASYKAVQRNNEPTLLPATSPGTYRVMNVEDGDTITVDMGGNHERVRLIGLNTPEVLDPRKPVQCFARAASKFTKNLIGDSTVRLEADPLSANRDRHNRLLRYVYLPDGRLAQADIISQGYGFALASFPFTKSEEFLKYQSEAKEQNRGLWAYCRPTPNKYGGFDSNPE